MCKADSELQHAIFHIILFLSLFCRIIKKKISLCMYLALKQYHLTVFYFVVELRISLVCKFAEFRLRRRPGLSSNINSFVEFVDCKNLVWFVKYCLQSSITLWPHFFFYVHKWDKYALLGTPPCNLLYCLGNNGVVFFVWSFNYKRNNIAGTHQRRNTVWFD
jgi:hypothetical protein